MIPGSRRFPTVGNNNSLQYSRLGTPWTEEPGRLQSTGFTRVRQDLVTKQQQNEIITRRQLTEIIRRIHWKAIRKSQVSK